MNSDIPTPKINSEVKRLINSHPLLFRGAAPSVPSYVSPGWYALIDQLLTSIETSLGADACATFVVDQIKEKFGGLRLYFHLTVPNESAKLADVQVLIDAACRASKKTCQTCGAPAELRDVDGRYAPLCATHLAMTKSHSSTGTPRK